MIDRRKDQAGEGHMDPGLYASPEWGVREEMGLAGAQELVRE